MAPTPDTHSLIIGDRNVNCGNITASFNTTINKSDEDAQVMRWLSPLEPGYRHDSVRNNRMEGVGNWFLETSEFREWRGGQSGADGAVLFGSGDPGVGKTHLSSLVIDKLCDQAREDDLVVAWLYCDYLAQQEQTIINIMGAILRQLLGRSGISKDLREAFREGRRPLLPDLVRILQIAIGSLSQVFICIDALDEFPRKDLPELLESLSNIVRESPRTRMFLTGRPLVKETIQRYFTKAVAILISPNQDEFRNYVEMKLDRDDEPEAMDKYLRADIVKMILDKMSDIFLLASLNIEAILGEMTIGQRRKKLKEIAQGSGLGDAYTGTIARLKAQKGNRRELGLQALMWVLCSERPLRAEALCHALGVEIGSAELDPENIPALRTLLASCLGLLTVEESSSTVRLVHPTLQEHLSLDRTLFLNPHSTIAEVCLTYVLFPSVKDLSPSLDSAPPTMPLLDYVSLFWGVHAKKGMTEKVGVLAQKFLDIYDKHISSRLMELGNIRGLNHGSTFSIAGVVSAMNEVTEVDVNAAELTGSVDPARAVAGGQVGVVKILSEKEDFNLGDGNLTNGEMTLILATVFGHEAVVKMLLEREDVNPDQPDTRYGRTPLSWAAEKGHEGIVRMLLERDDVNPDQPDTEFGLTPLSYAASEGYDGVVKMLLEREDVNPNRPDTIFKRTPLSWAAKRGHERVVKVLLERSDVCLAISDNANQTPLSWALSQGHHGIVMILLERNDQDSDKANHGGQAPLPPAAGLGDEFVVEMQSGSHDTNIDISGLNSQPQPPPAAHDEQAREWDHQDSISESTDNNPQPNSSDGPDFFPSDPETSSTAEGKPLSAVQHEQARELDPQDSISKSTNPTPQPRLPWWRILCIRLRKLFHCRRKFKTYASNS